MARRWSCGPAVLLLRVGGGTAHRAARRDDCGSDGGRRSSPSPWSPRVAGAPSSRSPRSRSPAQPGPPARPRTPSGTGRHPRPSRPPVELRRPRGRGTAPATLPSGRTVPIRPSVRRRTGCSTCPTTSASPAGGGRSRLGDPFGSVLVAAHVDSATQGLGPFAELSPSPGRPHPGGLGSLLRTYVVRSRRLVPQGSLADDSWISDVSGEVGSPWSPAPTYDSSRGGYQNLAVVTASRWIRHDQEGLPEAAAHRARPGAPGRSRAGAPAPRARPGPRRGAEVRQSRSEPMPRRAAPETDTARTRPSTAKVVAASRPRPVVAARRRRPTRVHARRETTRTEAPPWGVHDPRPGRSEPGESYVDVGVAGTATSW